MADERIKWGGGLKKNFTGTHGWGCGKTKRNVRTKVKKKEGGLKIFGCFGYPGVRRGIYVVSVSLLIINHFNLGASKVSLLATGSGP